ncbi:3'(2'),5'-bisphosphate nucleotidase CysQ [Acinetobacter sp. Ac_877]|uniref:3'(2'),5'-bisphosphate nucleotidase CysQ family protein n=1 Tax=Acinetobacter portensis TaxID=1839785 RepID=UPI00128CC0FA|nr:3'(2'),5'-bisphosphate nucleotidase CysQ [Acinetobacter portensis]MPW40705.1 3'(2'),5'-bisphosphate nucleotidase CysQ [Acinetobacter portensis]
MFKPTTAPQDSLTLQLVPILTQACEILREEYQQYCAGGTFDIEKKLDNSPVTQADYRVNTFLTSALAQISDLPLLSEEGDHLTRQNWQKFWMLDPLDGTKEFLHKRPEFTINLSVIDGENTSFAILAIPCEYTLYIAPETGFPLKYDVINQQWFIYAHSEQEEVVKIGLSQSSQNKPQYAEYLEAISQLSSYSAFKAGSAYKFCMMLEDKVDIYPRFHPTCEWDTSAGQCLLERIGGGLVDFKARTFLYNQRENFLNGGFIAYRNKHMKNLAFQALELMASKH